MSGILTVGPFLLLRYKSKKSRCGLLIKTQQKETASHMLSKHSTLVQAVLCKGNLI